jgi:signal transduction histidine kinase
MPAASRLIVPAWVQDAAIAVGVALLGFASGFGTGRNGQLPAVATALLTAMGLVLFPRRRFPGTVVALEAALVATLAVMRTSLEAAFIAVLVASYSAAVHGSRLLARVLLVAAVAAVAGLGIPAGLGADQWLRAHYPVPTILAAAGAWLVGLMVRKQLQTRTEHIALLAERAELLAARQAESERRATLAERLRIAREMHDIVAHHVSVVVIQAQGAQRVADSDPGRAKTAMADVERTGRTALEEMRRLLGLLRSGEPAADGEAGTVHQLAGIAQLPGGAYRPPQGLADIDLLAERLQRAGLGITIVRRGEPRGMPDDVALTVYRIVQESLTNVLKHAGPATVTVELEFADQLGVTVTDDGRGASAALSAVPGAGRGSAGMRERIAAVGGKLSTGPRPGGGYRVHATIPLGGAS